MDSLISRMQLHFFQNEFQEALQCAEEVLAGLDPDDDDDADKLYDILWDGLHSGAGMSFVDLLRKMNFDFTYTWPGKGGLAVLYADAGCGDPDMFRAMEEYGMDPFLTKKDGNTVLHVLAGREKSPWTKEREIEMARLVRERKDLSGWLEPNAYGATPLHLAVLGGHEELLKALLEQGVSPDLPGTAVRGGYGHVINFDGVTALSLACSRGNVAAAVCLLNAGADERSGDTRGWTPCHYAVEIPNRHFCAEYYSGIPGEQRVLERKAEILRHFTDVDICDDQGITPLLKSLAGYQFDKGGFCAVLLEKGADPNRADNAGRTPLQMAAQHRHKEAVKELVAAGADLNARNRAGETALLLAVREGDEKIARYLIKKGADPQLPDNTGMTAGEVAAGKGMEGVLELLL